MAIKPTLRDIHPDQRGAPYRKWQLQYGHIPPAPAELNEWLRDAADPVKKVERRKK